MQSKMNAQSNWKPVGIGQGIGLVPYIECMYNDTVDDLLYVGGTFTIIDNLDTAYQIAAWDGANWNRLKMGLYNLPYDIIRFQNKIYVGGVFPSADYNLVNAPYIATWDGVQWDSLPGGKLNGPVKHFEIINNELYVMGGFDSIGNLEVQGIAKWNGATWSDVNNFPRYSTNGNAVNDVAIYQGNIYVAGNFYSSTANIEDIAMYDGATWQSVGTPPGMYGGFNIVQEMEVFNNELYVGGDISKAAGNTGENIQKWNGIQWSDVGGGTSWQIRTMKKHNNELYVGGGFESVANGLVRASKIAKWDGVQWCALSDSIVGGVLALETYHDTLIIAGDFINIGGDTIHKIAKWDGGNYTDSCNVYVGVEDINDIESQVSIYPNPNTGFFTIELDDTRSTLIEIYTVSGQLILQKKLDQNYTKFNLTEHSKGLYFLRVKTPTETIIEKIVYQ